MKDRLWLLFELPNNGFHFCAAVIRIFVAERKSILFPDGIGNLVIAVIFYSYARNFLALFECTAMDTADISAPILHAECRAIRVVDLSPIVG